MVSGEVGVLAKAEDGAVPKDGFVKNLQEMLDGIVRNETWRGGTNLEEVDPNKNDEDDLVCFSADAFTLGEMLVTSSRVVLEL